MARNGGRGGRNLGGAMARATGAKKGSVVEPAGNEVDQEARPATVSEPQGARQPVPVRRARKAPVPRDRPGRRNQDGYSARSISVLESVYESLDQALADPEEQRRIKAQCAEWGVWVPQKKAGKSELVELLLLRWLHDVNG